MKYIHIRIAKLNVKKDLTQTLNQIKIKSNNFPFKMHKIHPNQVQIKSKSNQIHNSDKALNFVKNS